MRKSRFSENPSTKQLLEEGVLVMSQHKEERVITREDGETYTEVAITTKYIDRRSFSKMFKENTGRWLQFFEGSPRSQLPFILNAAVEKSINKDIISLSYADFCNICTEQGITPWKQPHFSKHLGMLLDAGFLFKTNETGKYFVDVSCVYNGSIVKQLGLEEKVLDEQSFSEETTDTASQNIQHS